TAKRLGQQLTCRHPMRVGEDEREPLACPAVRLQARDVLVRVATTERATGEVDADDRRPRMRDATQGVEGAARGGSDLDDRAGAVPLHQGKERRELPSLLYCSAHLRLTREPNAVPEAEPPQDRVGTHEVSNEEDVSPYGGHSGDPQGTLGEVRRGCSCS